MLVIMKLKQIILTAIFIVSCISFAFAQIDREKGVELFNKGDYKGAVEVLNQVVKSNENDVIALYNLGLAYEKLNQNKDAIKSFENVINVCNNLIQKTIEKKYGGIVNDNDKDTLSDLLKKYDTEFEIGYLSIQRFSELNPKDAKKDQWQEKISAIEAFAPNSEIAKTFVKERPANFKIISQPFAKAVGNGTVRFRVLFLANGKVGVAIPLNFLSKETNEAALRAAKKIKFSPAMVDGKPVSVWKMIEYRFFSR